jgi:hypothetical protein
MITAQNTKTMNYTEDEKKSLVSHLTNYKWERCVTLTTRRNHTLPELWGFLSDFIRRVDGRQHGKSEYWFGVSGFEYDRIESPVWTRGFYKKLHVHGVIRGVDTVTNEQLEKCWRNIPIIHTLDDGKTIEEKSQLGHTKIVHYDQQPEWLWYIVNQTRRGEIFTNLKEV